MKYLLKIVVVWVGLLMCYNAAYSSSIPNNDHPRTFLGPTARLGITSTLNDYTAYNIAGEAGVKNFRVGGTLGWALMENQRLKLSAEFLWQRINYAFFSGNARRWVEQGALGAAYQYDFVNYFTAYHPQFDLSAYFSHAPSKSLGTITGNYPNSFSSFTNIRRIAGSNGTGVAPGLAIMPWQGGRLSAELNYDNVRYDEKYSPVNHDAKGIGGTLGLNQAITDVIGLGLAAAVRKPFNNYAATLSWNNIAYHGTWSLSLFGDYTVGKETLPNTYNVGISADYFFDQRCGQLVPVPVSLKGENLKGEVTTVLKPFQDNLLTWTADPAVYMPQVLAIVDEGVTITDPSSVTCGPGSAPVLLLPLFSPIPLDVGTAPIAVINVAPNFSGSGLVFSEVHSTLPPAATVSITPAGILTLTAGNTTQGGSYTVTVTATNSCGSASSTILVTVSP